ncbi:hypothetical protein [Pseudoalteromonas galatheae]
MNRKSDFYISRVSLLLSIILFIYIISLSVYDSLILHQNCYGNVKLFGG